MPKLLLKLAVPNIENEFKYGLPGHKLEEKQSITMKTRL